MKGGMLSLLLLLCAACFAGHVMARSGSSRELLKSDFSCAQNCNCPTVESCINGVAKSDCCWLNNACYKINLQTDNNNCGSCGNVCATGQSCCSGSCVDKNTDINNCGSCGNVCTGDACANGLCLGCNTTQNQVCPFFKDPALNQTGDAIVCTCATDITGQSRCTAVACCAYYQQSCSANDQCPSGQICAVECGQAGVCIPVCNPSQAQCNDPVTGAACPNPSCGIF